MGCFPKFWRRLKRNADSQAPRPYSAKPALANMIEKRDSGHSGSTAYTIDEKSVAFSSATLSLPVSSLPGHVQIRASINPKFSAYATPLSSEELQRRTTQDWIDTPVTATEERHRSAWKSLKDDGEEQGAIDEDDDDPEAIKRQARLAEQRKLAERQEQERLDFFQML